jgi:hypothetical protein
MRRVVLRTLTALALVALGWAAGTAQTAQPDFELIVDAPGPGETTVQCLRGCEMAWVERGVNPSARPMPTFTYRCGGPVERCSSHKIGGWIKK